MAEHEGWEVALIPNPQVDTKVAYTYRFDDAPILVQASKDRVYSYLVTRIVITIETDSDIEGGFYVDHDAYGYRATKDGRRDMRTGTDRVWLTIEQYKPYEDDARRLFDGGVVS